MEISPWEPDFDPSEQKAISVSEFVSRARRLIESGLSGFVIEGEMSRFTRAKSRHCYFTIKDDRALLDCVMYSRAASGLDREPQMGDSVRVRGSASIYEARGSFQFIVESLEFAGQGELHERFLRLKRKLAAEGLFDRRRKRPIPRWPARIGIVASASSAALQDVLRTLKKRMPSIPATIYPTLSQGREAPAGIVAALNAASVARDCDTLILCRGGGGIEDLQAYNDEGVARAIAACAIPVVTGIGHEIDETIADHVADERTPTPTAAAARSVPDRAAEMRALSAIADRLAGHAWAGCDARAQRVDRAARLLRDPRQHVAALRARIESCAKRLLRDPAAALAREGGRLGFAHRRLLGMGAELRRRRDAFDALGRRLARAGKSAGGPPRARLDRAALRLEALDVGKVLERGFSLVRDSAGEIVRSAGAPSPGERLEIRFARGKAAAVFEKPLEGEEK